MKLSIIIPVYNEEKTLDVLYEQISKVPFSVEVEIIYIDDCSIDNSKTIIEALAVKDPRVKMIFKDKNEGKGSALSSGIDIASGDIIVVQDADLEYDPFELPQLIQLILNDTADVVYGSRFSAVSSQVVRYGHYLGNKALTVFSNLLSDIRLTDMETCYKCFKADIVKNMVIESKRFGFEPEVTAKIAKLSIRIHELPISYNQRSYAEGKKIGVKDGIEALWLIIKYNLLCNKQSYIKTSMPSKYLGETGIFK